MAHSLSGRGTAHLPGDYLAEHAELAYAGTTETTQGATIDRSPGLINERADRPDIYIALSRGRDTNMAYVITEGDPRSEYAQAQTLDGRQVLAQALTRESGAAGSIREARVDTRAEVVASDPIERARQVVVAQRQRDAERAKELGVAWNPDATGIEKAKQVTALQRAAREQDRARDLPGGRDGLER